MLIRIAWNWPGIVIIIFKSHPAVNFWLNDSLPSWKVHLRSIWLNRALHWINLLSLFDRFLFTLSHCGSFVACLPENISSTSNISTSVVIISWGRCLFHLDSTMISIPGITTKRRFFVCWTSFPLPWWKCVTGWCSREIISAGKTPWLT